MSKGSHNRCSEVFNIVNNVYYQKECTPQSSTAAGKTNLYNGYQYKNRIKISILLQNPLIMTLCLYKKTVGLYA